MVSKALMEFVDQGKSSVTEICATLKKKRKFGARPRCFIAMVPGTTIFHVLYAAILREISEECDVYVLLHDHLSPIFTKYSETPIKDTQRLLSAFGVKCEIIPASTVLQQVYFESEFVQMITFIREFDELVKKVTALTAAKISGDLHSMMAWAAEYYVASVWFPKQRRLKIDYVLFGADRYPLYKWVKESLLRLNHVCPGFMCVRHLFGESRKPLFINVNMTSTEIEDCILGSVSNPEAVRPMINDGQTISAYVSRSIGLSEKWVKEALTLSALCTQLSQIFQAIRAKIRRPWVCEVATEYYPFGWRPIRSQELDEFFDLFRPRAFRYLLKLVYELPGMMQTEYQQMLRSKYLKRIKQESRIKTLSAATIHEYFSKAEKIGLLRKDGLKWYPSYKSIELRLTREILEAYGLNST